MKEIMKGISFQEYYLTIIRIATLLDYLGLSHKKATTEDRILLYDFYLKYPELINGTVEKNDFDTKYSYFHWKPNYKLYSAVLTDLTCRKLTTLNIENNRYYITNSGKEFISNMENSYTKNARATSEYIVKNICKLSNKKITENIDKKLLQERGV